MCVADSLCYREAPFRELTFIPRLASMLDDGRPTYLSVLLTVQVIVRIGHHQLLQTKRSFSIAVEMTRETVRRLIQLCMSHPLACSTVKHNIYKPTGIHFKSKTTRDTGQFIRDRLIACAAEMCKEPPCYIKFI